jgi:hypothetical protein
MRRFITATGPDLITCPQERSRETRGFDSDVGQRGPYRPALAASFTRPPSSTSILAVSAKERTIHGRPAQIALLEELKNAAEKLGLSVREERLLREVGYRVRSGSCRVRDAEVIFLDRGLPTTAQIDVLVEELVRHPLDTIYLSPAARALLEGAAARDMKLDDGNAASR